MGRIRAHRPPGRPRPAAPPGPGRAAAARDHRRHRHADPGLALHGVTSQPTSRPGRRRTGRTWWPSPSVGPGPASGDRGPAAGAAGSRPRPAALTARRGHRHSGPYPVASRRRCGARGIAAPAEAEGRDQAPAAVDQPKLTQGSWVRPGGVVLERTFAEALGVGVGDQITLNGRPFRVAGIAVTAAVPPYPNVLSPAADCSMGLRPTRPGHAGTAWSGSPSRTPRRSALGAGAAVLRPEPEAQRPGRAPGVRQRVRLGPSSSAAS